MTNFYDQEIENNRTLLTSSETGITINIQNSYFQCSEFPVNETDEQIIINQQSKLDSLFLIENAQKVYSFNKTFKNCKDGYQGSIFHLTNTSFYDEGSIFDSNSALEGGSFFIVNSSIILNNTFVSNQMGFDGGFIYSLDLVNHTFFNLTANYSTALHNGGLIYHVSNFLSVSEDEQNIGQTNRRSLNDSTSDNPQSVINNSSISTIEPYIEYFSQISFLAGAQISHTRCVGYGGALYIDNQHMDVYLNGSVTIQHSHYNYKQDQQNYETGGGFLYTKLMNRFVMYGSKSLNSSLQYDQLPFQYQGLSNFNNIGEFLQSEVNEKAKVEVHLWNNYFHGFEGEIIKIRDISINAQHGESNLHTYYPYGPLFNLKGSNSQIISNNNTFENHINYAKGGIFQLQFHSEELIQFSDFNSRYINVQVGTLNLTNLTIKNMLFTESSPLIQGIQVEQVYLQNILLDGLRLQQNSRVYNSFLFIMEASSSLEIRNLTIKNIQINLRWSYTDQEYNSYLKVRGNQNDYTAKLLLEDITIECNNYSLTFDELKENRNGLQQTEERNVYASYGYGIHIIQFQNVQSNRINISNYYSRPPNENVIQYKYQGFQPIRLANVVKYFDENSIYQNILSTSYGVYYIDKAEQVQNGSEVPESFTINNCTIKNIVTHDQGGLIFVEAFAGNATIRNSSFKNLFGSSNGKLIYSSSSTFSLLMRDSVIDCSFAQIINSTLIDRDSFYSNNQGNSGVLSCFKCNMTIQNSTFKDNQANDGGAFLLENSGNVQLQDLTLYNNSASLRGGVIAIQQTDLSDLTPLILEISTANMISTSQFQINENNAFDGGFMYVSNKLAKIRISNITIQNSQALNYGGMIFIEQADSLTFQNTTFLNSSASNGDSIYSIAPQLNIYLRNTSTLCLSLQEKSQFYMSQSTLIFIESSQFQNCWSKQSSGVFYLENSNLQDFNSSYINNVGTNGGVFFSTSSNLTFANSSFINNTADIAGVFRIQDQSILTLNNCTFSGNQAVQSAGVIQVSSSSQIQIDNSLFENNYASEKSILDIQSSNQDVYSFSELIVKNTRFDNPIVTNIQEQIDDNTVGSFMFIISEVTLTVISSIFQNGQSKQGVLRDSIFHNSTSQYGGAVYIEEIDDSKTSEFYDKIKYIIDNCTFSNNSSPIGGAIYIQNLQSMRIKNSTFMFNIAFDKSSHIFEDFQGSGGALYFTCISDSQSQCQLSIENDTQFIGNIAYVQGGAVFWDVHEPFFDNSIVYSNNLAGFYANNIGCYVQKIGVISQTDYLNILDIQGLNNSQIQKRMLGVKIDQYPRQLDQSYNNFNINNFQSGGKIEVIYLALIDKYGQIVGSDSKSTNQFAFGNGVTAVEGVIFSASPGFNYSITLQTDGIDITKKTNIQYMQSIGRLDLDYQLNINLRECILGERFTPQGKCNLCIKDINFLLQKQTSPGDCENCPIYKAHCLGGAVFGPKPGYWRKSNVTSTIVQCSYELACLGMVEPNNNPIGDCAQGYSGVICSDCMVGYSRTGENKCGKCPDYIINIVRLIFIIIALILLIILLIRSTLQGALNKRNITNIFMKILLNHFQLIMLTASFDFEWSQQTQEFFTGSKQVATFMFYDFKCREIDGENRVMNDMEVVCWGQQHFFYSMAVAIPSIFFWGLGIPFFALIIMFRVKNKFLIVNSNNHPYVTLALNDLENLSLISSMATIYCGIFFIVDKPQQWIDKNPEYSRGSLSLSHHLRQLIFSIILISNTLFFVYWSKLMYNEIKAKFRGSLPKIYTFICLCNNKVTYDIELIQNEIQQEHFHLHEQFVKILQDLSNQLKNQLKLNKNNISTLIAYFNTQNIMHAVGYKDANHDEIYQAQASIFVEKPIRSFKQNKKFDSSRNLIRYKVNDSFQDKFDSNLQDSQQLQSFVKQNHKKRNKQKRAKISVSNQQSNSVSLFVDEFQESNNVQLSQLQSMDSNKVRQKEKSRHDISKYSEQSSNIIAVKYNNKLTNQ
eukprot:403374635